MTVPPSPALHRPPPPVLREVPVGDSAVPRIELREWAERHGVVAGITTRGRGFSLGLWSEENVGQVMTRWRAGRPGLRPPLPGPGAPPPIPRPAGPPPPPAPPPPRLLP